MADLYRELPQDLGLADHVAALRRRDRNTTSSSASSRASRRCGRSGETARPARRSATSSRSTACASTVEDGTWGLVRASSNKPELVVVVESPVVGSAHAGDVRRGRRACCARTQRSAPITRRSDPPRPVAPILPDVLAPGLRIVFCGTAAGTESARRRCYYAHPQNKFWRALHEVGLTDRRLDCSEFALLPQFGIGLTDIAKTASGMDKEAAGRARSGAPPARRWRRRSAPARRRSSPSPA